MEEKKDDLETENHNFENEVPDVEKLKGVGGWLAFLIIGLVFIGPIINAFQFYFGVIEQREVIFANINDTHSNIYEIFAWIMFSLYISLMIFAGLMLYKRHKKSTIPIVIGLIWLFGPVASGLILLAEYDREVLISLVRSIIYSSIWTAYLLMSKRVKNTYI